MPAELQVAKASYRFGSGGSAQVQRIKVPISLGLNEIARLRMMRVYFVPDIAVDAFQVVWALWRKTDDAWSESDFTLAALSGNQDVVAAGTFLTDLNTSGARATTYYDELQVPDPGLVLLRSPQLLFEMDVALAYFGLGVVAYYTKEKVSKDRLAQLMVKDHA